MQTTPSLTLTLFLLLLPPLFSLTIGVTGSSGRLGSLVVSSLARSLPRNSTVRALCRDEGICRDKLKDLVDKGDEGDVDVVVQEIDLTSRDGVAEGMKGLDAIVTCHGASNSKRKYFKWAVYPRFWGRDSEVYFEGNVGGRDLGHPYYAHYVSTKNILSGCSVNGVKTIVSVTGLTCGLDPKSIVSVIFNAVMGFGPMWHRASEDLIRSSPDVDNYLIVRPGGMDETPRDKTVTNVEIDLSGTLPPPGFVSRHDVAELMSIAAVGGGIGGGSNRATAAVRATGIVRGRDMGNLNDGKGSVIEAANFAISKLSTSGGGKDANATGRKTDYGAFKVVHGAFVVGVGSVFGAVAWKILGGLFKVLF